MIAGSVVLNLALNVNVAPVGNCNVLTVGRAVKLCRGFVVTIVKMVKRRYCFLVPLPCFTWMPL